MQRKAPINVIIAEDNSMNRELIASYFAEFPQVHLLGSAGSGQEALNLVQAVIPTAVFLDIEMPDINGLSVAEKIRRLYPNVFIVFITAHAEYAAEAFQFEATDYLVKPISIDSLARAIKRIEKLQFNTSRPVKEQGNILLIKNSNETYMIHLDKIICVEKEIRKTIIHTEEGKYFTSETLSSLEQRLNQNFFRCHKSFIINLNKVEKISPIAERIYRIHFYNCQLSAPMGRPKLEQLYKIISNVIAED